MKRNRLENDNQNYSRRTDLRFRLSQMVCAILIISILTLSAPAAPLMVKVSLGELHQDIRFGLLSGSFGASFAGWTNTFLLFFAGKQQTASIGKIEILPGNITIRQGQSIDFSAIAYDTNGEILSDGLTCKWTVQDVDRNLQIRSLADETFLAKNVGNFIVTAKIENHQAQVRVKVEKNENLFVMKKIKEEESQGKDDYVKKLKNKIYTRESISSKKDYKAHSQQENYRTVEPDTEKGQGPNTGNSDSESEISAASGSNSQMMRPDGEPGWDDGNWWTADNPGNQIGNPPGTSPDAIAGNGNFQLSVPVVALPGRGIDLNLSMHYNSRLWSKSGNEMSYDSDKSFPAPGWSLGFGKIIFMGEMGGCMMIDADGTRHGYGGTRSHIRVANSTDFYHYFTGYTADGTFIDYTCQASKTTSNTGVVTSTMSATATLPNGTKVDYNSHDTSGRQAFPTKITDAQGNYITIYYRNNSGPEIQQITDTMGRVVTFQYDSLNQLKSVMVRLAYTNSRTTMQLRYKQITLNAGFSGLTTDVANSNPSVIESIYNQTTANGYWFGDPDSYSSYGMITKVIEQRAMGWNGGAISSGTMSKKAVYNYPLSPDYTLTDAPTFTTLTESWAGMDTGAPVTSYSVNNNDSHHDGTSNSPARSITVTQPNGVISKQYSYRTPGVWTDGLVFSDETIVMNGSVPDILSSSLVSWQPGSYDSPRPTWTKVKDEKDQELQTTYTYGTNYNQLESQKEFDYDGQTLKETRNSYENSSSYTGRHIFNLVKTSEVFDGVGNRVARTDYEYDNNAVAGGTQNHNLKATPGVTKHLATADPYTSELVDGACISGQFNYSACTYEGEIITIYQGGWIEATCIYECTEYEQVSAYDPNTIFRGNITKVTGYADAQYLTGAISQTKQYDVTGNLVAESASCCQLRTYDYTIATQFAYPTRQTRGSSDPNSTIKNTTVTEYDFYSGLVKRITDANGRISSVHNNSLTLRPMTFTSSTGVQSHTAYDDAAMTVTEQTSESAGSVLTGKIITYLNGVGQVIKQEIFDANNVASIVETKYNNLGQIWKQTRPYRAGQTPQWTETIYDVQGRTKRVTEPDGSFSEAFYNENDPTQKPDSALTLTGNTVRVADAWGRERWGRYDAQGRLAEVVEPNPVGNGSVLAAGSWSTKYKYDTMARLIETEQGAQRRYFKYDSLGRLTRQKLAEQTATLDDAGTYVGAGQTGAQWGDSFIYDGRSNMTQKTDARGVKTNFVYSDPTTGAEDPLNRLRSVIYDSTGPQDTSQPINPAFNITYDYMTAGDQDRIKKIESPGLIKEEYDYDVEGRVRDFTQTVSDRTSYPMATSYIYDVFNRVTDVRYPAQYGLAGSPRKLVQQTYDSVSRLSTLKVDGLQQAGNILFNAADQTTSIRTGTGTNQVTESYEFDSQTGLLTNQKVQRGGQNLLDLSYDYQRHGSVGNKTGKTGHLSKITNNLDASKNRTYEYDALGRLTKAKGGDVRFLWQQQYSYDRFGNRESVTATGVAADSSTIPTDGIPNLSYDQNTNRITSGNSSGQFQYDAAGNQVKALAEDGQTWLRYEYDYANRLSVVKRDSDGQALQAFQYSPTGGRLMNYDYLSNEFILYANSGGTTLSEYREFASNVPTWTKSFVYLGDGLLSTITPNGAGGETTEYNHPDRLGTRLITNPATGGTSEQTTLPFGTALNGESTITNNKNRFTTYDRSARTGLDYAVNRNYDSKQGRFTTVDPIGMSASSLISPQTLNLYSYCGNDPINYTDPSGLFFGKLFGAISKIFSAVNKILKWVAIIVAVILVVALIVYTAGGAMPAFLGDGLGSLIGLMGKIGAKMSSFMAGAIGVEVGKAAGFSIAAALYGIGAIANEFQMSDKRRRRGRAKSSCPPNSAVVFFGGGDKQYKKYVEALKLSKNGREHGGWVYQNSRGQLKAVLKDRITSRDTAIQIDLVDPPSLRGEKVVGTFHTHEVGGIPSGMNKDLGNGTSLMTDDYLTNHKLKVPGMIISTPKDGGIGFMIYGPTSGFFRVGLPTECIK